MTIDPCPTKVKRRRAPRKKPHEGPPGKTMLIKGVPPVVHQMFKGLCARRGITLSAGIADLMRDEVRKHGKGPNPLPEFDDDVEIITQDDDL